jgi:hypothetical protein
MAKTAFTTAKKASCFFTIDDLALIREYPHILGHLAGYKDLTILHSNWVRYVWEYDGEKLRSMMAHRGSFKTSGVTVVGAVWRLLFHPDQTIMILRKTHAEAVDTVATIAKIFHMQEIRELFFFAHGEYPEFKLERIGEGKLDFSFKKKTDIAPSIIGMGSSSPLTGKHADIVIVDDLSTLLSRLSRAEREMDKQIWREVATNIVNRNGFCRYVGTPWHPDGVESIIPTPIKFPYSITGLISEANLAEIKLNTTPTLFACNYELEFVSSENALFKDPVWGDWMTDEIEGVRAHLDMAYGGGDTTALTIAARRSSGKIQAVGFRFTGNGADWLNRIGEILKMYKCRIVATENNADKGWTVKELKNRGFAVKDYNESTNKVHKISTYLWECWPNLVWCKETDPEYMVQITDWTAEQKSAGLDDSPDSAASLCRAFYSKKASMVSRWTW